MIIVVDTNILISSIITPGNKISEILFSPLPTIQLVSANYAVDEINQHEEKIVKSSKLSLTDVRRAVQGLVKQVEFFEETIIETIHWQEAARLTSGVDAKDITFVALVLQINGLLWTGDKRLTNHLKVMNFDRVVATQELYKIIFDSQN